MNLRRSVLLDLQSLVDAAREDDDHFQLKSTQRCADIITSAVLTSCFKQVLSVTLEEESKLLQIVTKLQLMEHESVPEMTVYMQTAQHCKTAK